MYLKSHCVVPENVHTTPTEGICCMSPPHPSEFSKIGPQNLPPPTHQNFQNFCTTLELLLSLIEVNK